MDNDFIKRLKNYCVLHNACIKADQREAGKFVIPRRAKVYCPCRYQ